MKRSRRELSIDMTIHRGIAEDNQITLLLFLRKTGVSFCSDFACDFRRGNWLQPIFFFVPRCVLRLGSCHKVAAFRRDELNEPDALNRTAILALGRNTVPPLFYLTWALNKLVKGTSFLESQLWPRFRMTFRLVALIIGRCSVAQLADRPSWGDSSNPRHDPVFLLEFAILSDLITINSRIIWDNLSCRVCFGSLSRWAIQKWGW